MIQATKSSITLPPAEFRLVRALRTRLRLPSNVEVVRRGLRLLAGTTDRREPREAYRRASRASRAALEHEIASLDRLADEGID